GWPAQRRPAPYAREKTARQPVPEQLLGEKRIALTLGVEAAANRRRRRLAKKPGRECGNSRLGQRGECHRRRHPQPVQLRQGPTERGITLGLAAAVTASNQG